LSALNKNVQGNIKWGQPVLELIQIRSSSQLLVPNRIQTLKSVSIVSTFFCADIRDFMFTCVYSLPLHSDICSFSARYYLPQACILLFVV